MLNTVDQVVSAVVVAVAAWRQRPASYLLNPDIFEGGKIHSEIRL